MSSRSPQLYLSPFSRPFAVADYTSALSLCCTYARDAASEGRFLAAHGLFQSAVTYFDLAQQLMQREERSFHDWSFIGDVDSFLLSARAELDECASYIYPDGQTKLDLAQSKNNAQ